MIINHQITKLVYREPPVRSFNLQLFKSNNPEGVTEKVFLYLVYNKDFLI